MRSYWMSLTFVAVLLGAYTALVLNTHQPTRSASADQQPREPVAAAQAATTDDAAANVN